MRSRFILILLVTGGLLTAGLGYSLAQEGVEQSLDRGQEALEQGKTDEAIAHLLDAIRQQQQLLLQLQATITGQLETLQNQEKSIAELDERVEEQETVIEEQKTTIAEYEQKLEEYESGTKTAVAAVEEVREIDQMYEQAYLTRRTGIFDVRRRDAEPYFRKSIDQFRYIAETYPASRRAPDAQYQVAKTYHRWLNDTTQAIREYKVLVEKWPDSPFAREAREALSELGQPTAP